ncbi:NDP-sugar synthase [Janibacter anophelis]
MHPLTLTRPKHLLPVGGVPVLDLQLRRLHEVGVSRVVLATARHAEQVAGHVASHPVEGLDVLLSDEGTPLGTGGGLLAALEVLDAPDDEPVVVVNGDLLTGHDLRAQVAACSPGTDIVLHVRAVDDPTPFGTVDVAVDGRRVVDFREKVPGPPGTLVNAGTYVVRAGILRERATGEEQSWEREILPVLIADGAVVLAHRDDAWFADIGSPDALLTATRAALDGTARPALPTDYDPRRAIDPDAVIDEGAQLEASTVGAGARVGGSALVRGSILLADVRVGTGAVVVDSVLGEGVTVADGAVVRHRAIADGAHVPRGDTADGHDEGSSSP